MGGNMVSATDKADQLERDLNVRHPVKAMHASLRRRDDYHEVTPFHARVGRDRLRELVTKGLHGDDGAIVLLMRGARIETLARAAGEAVEELVAQVKARLRQLNPADMDLLIVEAQRNLDLWRRA